MCYPTTPVFQSALGICDRVKSRLKIDIRAIRRQLDHAG